MFSQPNFITLLTDFGLSDIYVGVLKGVIAQINPALRVVDLTHQIPPQDIVAARFCLMSSYAYFPKGTVHVAVVDPGVGSQRRGIALKIELGFLIGPDNGLFSGVLSQTKVLAAVELTNPEYWRKASPSTTFHGRDIFASAGAHLASGVPLERLGKAIDPTTLVELSIPAKQVTEAGITGCIQYIDYFGNLITNIPAVEVERKNWLIIVENQTIVRSHTYSDCSPGEALALIGSHGWVEIAVNSGSARSRLQVNWGAIVELIFI
ncbi:MAG: SAM-dependent chlorinase/fluorinase [Symploca sp. SIO2E9]|nr:SAM-dependent chlorinase/fluorinase [Symploca sp. SIO2E9]